MILHFLLLASLAYASNTSTSLVSPSVDPNITLSLPSLKVQYRCSQNEFGRPKPSALDCLNIFTYVLATTPKHDDPTEWSRSASSGRTKVPYRRSSGTCELYVRLSATTGPTTVETASVDQVIGAAMRIVEVCLLNGSPELGHWGGVALAGSSRLLDIIVWGGPVAGDVEGAVEGASSNGTVALEESGSVATEDQ